MEVYLDVLMLLNFAVDLLLIMGTNRLSGHPPGARRAMPAAVLGSIYAAGCVLPGFAFLGGFFWRMVFLGLMSAIAFGCSQSGLRRGILFVLLSMAVGGIATCMDRGGFWALVMAALGLCGLCALGFRGRAGQQRYVEVTIGYGGKTATIIALVDTGNTLRDPLSGRPVLVVDEVVASKLCAFSSDQLIHPIETLATACIPGLRLIPYTAVGSTAGMLLGIRPDSVMLDGKEMAYIVAFAPQRLGQGGYQALAGGVL